MPIEEAKQPGGFWRLVAAIGLGILLAQAVAATALWISVKLFAAVSAPAAPKLDEKDRLEPGDFQPPAHP